MREIKFRAWDKIAKPNRMKSWEQLLAQYQLTLVFTSKDFELMQSTGLKDRNGVEIYEGDIYHQGDRNILHVVEYTQDCSFMGRQIRTKGSRVGLAYWQDKIEVIGNIHDNPELLESEAN